LIGLGERVGVGPGEALAASASLRESFTRTGVYIGFGERGRGPLPIRPLL